MKIIKSKNIVLFLLIMVFIAPGLAAIVFYKHPQWLGSGSTNKGTLLSPAVLLPAMQSKAKWGLVLWSPKGCHRTCRQQLDKLGRMRLALGRRLYEVDQWLLTDDSSRPLSNKMIKRLHEQDIHWLRIPANTLDKPALLTNTPQVFITNPDSFLVMSYDLNARSADIFYDIKQLLNTPGGKSG